MPCNGDDCACRTKGERKLGDVDGFSAAMRVDIEHFGYPDKSNQYIDSLRLNHVIDDPTLVIVDKPHQVIVRLKKLPNFVAMPEYKTKGAAAMDLYAAQDCIVRFGELPVMIPTGIAIQLPFGYEAQIRARSGMASKGIIVTNAPGTIDCDYTGEIKVLLSSVAHHTLTAEQLGIKDLFEYMKLSAKQTEGFQIKKGDRIAQMLIAPVTKAVFDIVDELEDTERGAGGFGSTGK